MKRAFLAVLFLFAAGDGFAQSAGAGYGGVAGRVTDAETGAALAGTTVTLTRGGRPLESALTDARGRFRLVGLDAGPAILGARRLGYGADSVVVRVEAGTVSTAALALSPAAISLSPLEIIGSAVAVRQMTGTATRLAPEVVQQIAPMGTQEILRYVPGVNGFADDGMGNSRLSIGIRGLNPRRSSRVLILEDGVPIQPALYVYPNMYYNPPAERIERVEVIKGSAAIRYGPQTMGGVINYITRRPRKEFGVLGQVTGGTNGYLSLFTEVGGWGTETVHPEVQLLYKRGDGFRENNAFEQYNATFKLNLLPNPDRVVYIKANANYEDSNATYTGLTEYSFLTDPTFNPKRFDNFRIFRSSLDVLVNDQLGENLTSNTKAYVSLFDRDWWREQDIFIRAGQLGEPDPTPVPWYQGGDLVRVGGGVEARGNLRTFYVAGLERSYDWSHAFFGMPSTLEFGGRVHWERFIDAKEVGDAPDARDGIFYTGDPEVPASVEILGQSQHYTTTALALYASERVEAGRLTVTPGARFELFEQERIDRLRGSTYLDKTSYVILPGVGANYDLGRVQLFGGIHRGYTPPSSGTLKIVNFGAEVAEGGLDLRPETSWNSELGLRGAFPWVGFEAAAFHVAIEDLVAAGRGTAFRNLGAVRSYGVELGGTLRGSFLSRFSPDFHLAYTYLQTEVEEGVIASAVRPGVEVSIAGNELPYAPEHTLAAGVSRDFASGLSLRADVHHVSEVYTDFENITATFNRGDTGPVQAHTTIDASASYRVGPRLRATLAAKNLLDEVYIGSRLHSNPGQPEPYLSSGILPGPRRQVNLGLTYEF